MVNKIKKILMITITCLLVFIIGGCSKPETSRTSDIPQDGIVKASVFKQLIEDDDMALFNGEDNKIKYQWMFLGSDIKEPKDINLLLKFDNKHVDEVKKELNTELIQGFNFVETEKIDSNPALSITIDKKWNATSADIYKYEESNKKLTKISGATVDNSNETTINLSVIDREGEFYIVGTDPKDDSSESENLKTDKKSDSSDESNTENKTESTEDSSTGKDKYNTDPIPEGKPKPVEPENTEVDKANKKYATLSIRCDTLLKAENYKVVTENGKGEMVPKDGVIFAKKQVVFYEGESVFDVLSREVKNAGIHMEHEFTPMYNSVYVEGINNLYEFDGGELSGWMYKVDGWFPNYGCSRYQLKGGDNIEWVYTCDLGRDVGRD